jgi:catalase
VTQPTATPDPAVVAALVAHFARMGEDFPASRPIHTRGVECEGTFTATPVARTLSRARHLRGSPVRARVRFSNGLPGPDVPDTAVQPRGCAVSFLAGGTRSDLVAVDVPGFFASTPREFLAFLDASGGDGFDAFLASHPRTADYLQRALSIAPPRHWLSVAYHAGHAVLLVDDRGTARAGRFRLLPAPAAGAPGSERDGGEARLTPDEVAARGPDYLHEELAAHVTAGTAALRLVVQLAAPGDPTDDVQQVWPDERLVLELGTLAITAVRDPTAGRRDDPPFDVARLGDGLAPAGDPLVAVRSQVYARSSARRRAAAGSAPRRPDRAGPC